MGKVIRTEHGWAGHFRCANRFQFRRNTLLTCGDINIVVSTVGQLEINGKIKGIGCDRYYETMAFFSKKDGLKYHDIDVEKQIEIDSNWKTEIQ